MSDTSPLYIVDGSGYIFRAYYAIRHLSTSKGLPTNAVYGFTQMLLKLLKDANPEHLVMVFDSKEPSFRKKEYELYKANREQPPEDLAPQFDYIRKVVDALNIPMLAVPGFEADDIIATIAKKMVPAGRPVVIVTADKDLMQLVTADVELWDTMRDKKTGIEGVKEKFGVTPEQVVDILALMGDTSDNIPGVPGIGPKTATQLIQQYGSLDGLYARVGEIKGKKGEDLLKFKDQAYLSKRLATLNETVPLEHKFESFRKREFDPEKCRALFQELEFPRLVEEFGGGASAASPAGKTLSSESYRLVTSEAELAELAAKLSQAEVFAVDTETTSLNQMGARLVGLSFAVPSGEAYYVPVGHKTERTQIPLERVLEVLRPILEDPDRKKVAQNAKYDTHVLLNHGVNLQGVVFDTMIASYLLDPAQSHKLDNLAARRLQHKMISFEEVTGKDKDFSLVDPDKASEYSCEDADVTLRLYELFKAEVDAERVGEVLTQVELPLSRVLLEMERTGIKLDVDFLQKLAREFGERIAAQEKKIEALAGGPFNVNSTKQLGAILFDKLQLPVVKKTKTGYSTDVDVLTELSKLHELPKEILEYRSLSKLKSTYVDALLAIADPQTHRVHTSFNQTIAETGRLSSTDPNLQNIPIRSEDGAKIRRAFVADEGFTLMSADYSQIELRVLAHMSEDPLLLEAFAKNLDIHRLTASSIFGVEESEVTPRMRAAGKTVNFAVVYGQGPFGLSQQLEVSQQEAKKYIEQYFQRYARVKSYRETILEGARKTKEVRTLMGRRRFVPEIESKNTMARNMAERVAFNTVIQGTAADLIKKAMVDLSREMGARKLRSRMLLQVHDELVFEVERSEAAVLKALIREKMEGVARFRVPLTVEIGEGPSWSEAHS